MVLLLLNQPFVILFVYWWYYYFRWNKCESLLKCWTTIVKRNERKQAYQQ